MSSYDCSASELVKHIRTKRVLRIAMSSFYLPSESKIGAGHMAHRLATAMVERGHLVTMFSPCSRPVDATYQHVRVDVHSPLRTFRWGYSVRQLDLNAFDVFHAHGDDYLRIGRPTPPHVRTLHGSCFSEAWHIRGMKARIRMVALGATEFAGSLVADETVAVSENSRKLYPWVKQVIPNGVDLRLFSPGTKTDIPTVLFVGTFRNRKRGQLLMDIFAHEVLPVIPEAKLWMVCSDAPNAPGVEVLGRLTDEELADRYRRAWVFCLPSSYEGFGVPYIEAMASGTPVVASPNPGALEVLDAGQYGVSARDNRLGYEIVRLLTDPRRREVAALKGLSRAQEYDWSLVAAAYEDIYRRLIPC